MVAIYARQSIDKKDSVSIEGQIEYCNKVIPESTDSPTIFQDRGYSGKNTERPALKKLIAQIEKNEIDTLIVYKLDRISRNITDFYKLYEIMENHHCTFISATENFDTGNIMGKALMGILAVFAQMERENIQKRVKDNYYYRTSSTGSWAGGPAPFGFINGRTKENKPTLIRDEKAVETVEAIFYYYAGPDHYSLNQIGNILKQQNYFVGDKKFFNNVALTRVLRNTVYVKADKTLYQYFKTKRINFLNSEEDWDGTRSCHIVGKKHNQNFHSYTDMSEQSVYLTNFEGFIDSFIYIQAQDYLEKNKQLAGAKCEGTRLEELSGKIKCSKCGYAIKSYHMSDDGRPYLSCYGKTSLKSCDCRFNKVNFFELQKKVGTEIQKRLDDMSSLRKDKIFAYYNINEEIKQLESESNILLALVKKEGFAAKKAMEELETTEQKIYELQLKAQLIEKSLDILPLQLVWQTECSIIDDSLSVVYEDLSTKVKKEIVNLLIDKILLKSNGDITIQWLI